ncbi:MAG: ATP synthase F1 subunit gamma, partial [Candidatus Adlerbacteria bacterium]
MAGLKAIKSQIRSYEKTQTVTKAMEAVSAAKMRKAQVQALHGRPYATAAMSILARVSGSQELRSAPLAAVRTVSNALYIVVTSDKGLAGALNSAVLRAVMADIQTSGLSVGDVKIVAIGKKANDFFTARGFVVEAYHPNNDKITSDIVREIVDEAAHRFTLGVVDVVKVGYQNFVSTLEQRPVLHTVFPLSLTELSKVVEAITPTRGAFAGQAHTTQSSAGYTVEPSEEKVLETLIPKLAAIFVYHALLESKASEHSARMVSMKSASDKAGEM